jgi:MtaA/CmuA family methyltransferase
VNLHERLVMDAHQRLYTRLRGLPVDRPPNFNIMMQFAAHYIGQPLSAYYSNHRVLVEANLAVQQAFDLDIVQVISDPYREPADLGMPVEFPFDGLPIRKQPLLADISELGRVRMPDGGLGRRMSDRVAAVSLLRTQVGGRVPVMGWVEGALAQAATLRGVSDLLLDMADAPQQVSELLERCAEIEIAFARAQVQAGADIIGLGDAIASQVSPRAYRAFALPYEQRIFAAVHEMSALTRLHICGNTTHLLPDMAHSGADIVDIDWMVDFGQAAAACAGRAVVCGNMDPVAVMLQGTPADVERAVTHCLQRGGPRCISAAGCEIVDGTPTANLHAQTCALRADAGRQAEEGRAPS